MQRCLLRNHLGIPYSLLVSKRVFLLTDGLGDDVVDLLDFNFGELTSALGGVDLRNAEHQKGESAAETLDDAETESSLLLAINVGVLHTQNVLEIVSVLNNQSGLQTGYQAMPRESFSPLTRFPQRWLQLTRGGRGFLSSWFADLPYSLS